MPHIGPEWERPSDNNAGWAKTVERLNEENNRLRERIAELERVNTVYADRLCAQNEKMNELREAMCSLASLEATVREMREALAGAPILSKYHGTRGFETDRFIGDYEAFFRFKIAPAARSAESPVREPVRPSSAKK